MGYTALSPDNIGWLFALELLHGVCFALMWSALVERLRQLTVPGWGATMQACTPSSSTFQPKPSHSLSSPLPPPPPG